MAKKRGGAAQDMDLSSFMSILLMTIGCLITVLVSNTLIIVSNPENVQIANVISASVYMGDEEGEGDSQQQGRARRGPPAFSNVTKQPAYIDVFRDRLVLYSIAPDKTIEKPEVLPLADLELRENALDRFLMRVERKKSTDYIVLLARPGSAHVFQRLRKVIMDRGIDVGHELFEEGSVLE